MKGRGCSSADSAPPTSILEVEGGVEYLIRTSVLQLEENRCKFLAHLELLPERKNTVVSHGGVYFLQT